jgi:hypothetical protein
LLSNVQVWKEQASLVFLKRNEKGIASLAAHIKHNL